MYGALCWKNKDLKLKIASFKFSYQKVRQQFLIITELKNLLRNFLFIFNVRSENCILILIF